MPGYSAEGPWNTHAAVGNRGSSWEVSEEEVTGRRTGAGKLVQTEEPTVEGKIKNGKQNKQTSAIMTKKKTLLQLKDLNLDYEQDTQDYRRLS